MCSHAGRICVRYADRLDIFEHATLYKKFSRTANSSLCAAFLSRVEELGRYCILYTYKSFAAAYLDMSALSRYDFWLAHYTARTDYTGPYGMWQYTSSGSVPGISGRVDCNRAYKDYPAIITGKKEESDNMSDLLKLARYRAATARPWQPWRTA